MVGFFQDGVCRRWCQLIRLIEPPIGSAAEIRNRCERIHQIDPKCQDFSGNLGDSKSGLFSGLFLMFFLVEALVNFCAFVESVELKRLV